MDPTDMNQYYLPTTEGADMTAAIEEKLRTAGVCLLGTGTYLVRGVNMPENTTLRGMGRGTRLLLDPALSAGYTVKMNSFCGVSDMTLMGAVEEIPLPEQVGERHGLLFEGTCTTKNWMGDGLKLHSTVSNCWMQGFTGGGLTCVDTGYYVRASITATNCHLFNNGAGINISHFSEYHEFTNMLCSENLYGCINNGGNNMFVNCGFNANKLGFLIDNSQKQSPNNSHGSAVGCTFNHTDNNEGVGVMILGANSGYIFSGCQMFFSKIVIENSEGIVFDTTNYGRKVSISVKGAGLTMFTNSVFQCPPDAITLTDAPNVKFINCYTRADGQPIGV